MSKPVRPRTRKQSAIECSLENKSVFDNALFHGLRRVHCSNLEKCASIVGFYRSTNLNKVAMSFSNSTLTIWSVVGYPDMRLIQSLRGFKGWIQHCIWSQCDNFLVVISDALLYVFHRNQTSGDFEHVAKYKPHDFPVSDVFWSKTDAWVNPEEVERQFTEELKCDYSFISASYDGTVRLWRMQDVIDGKYIVIDKNEVFDAKEVKGWDSTVMSYGNLAVDCPDTWGVKQNPNDPKASEVIISPKLGHSGRVTCVDGDTDSTRIVSGGADHQLLLWDIAEGVITKVYNRKGFHEAAILSVRWSYEKDIFASCSADACVYLWSTKYSIPLISFVGHHFAVDSLLFINSHKLLSSGRDGFILVWDIKVGGVVDSEMKHGRETITKTFIQKMKPKIKGWINSFCCTPEGLDLVVLTANMRESLFLFSPKYTDPDWLLLPFHKKLFNFFARHFPKKKPKKPNPQLIENYKSKDSNNPDVKQIVNAPSWSTNDKRKYIRADSWSWNQHLIDYGDDLSKKKAKTKRRASVLQTLRKKMSVRSLRKSTSKDYDSISERVVDDEERSKRILGRGYSSDVVNDPASDQAPKLYASLSVVFDPMVLDTTPENDDENEGGGEGGRRGSVWALANDMEEMEMDALQLPPVTNQNSSSSSNRSKIYAAE